jgi:3-oxoacyl-[acyl-carrier protein] reductase
MLDYDIVGKTALVCGSSAGIGRGCAEALIACGVDVVLNGRDEGRLRAAAAEVSAKSGTEVQWVAADVAQPEGRSKLFDHCPSPDILVTNAAGPPTGDFRDFDEIAWHSAVDVSMIAPIMLIRAVVDGMIGRQWGRIINITSTAVKAPLPLLGLSNGARSGLTGFVSGLARDIAASGVTINNLLPGKIDTARLATVIGKMADSQSIPSDAMAERMAASNPMKRFGTTEEIGAFCAFLCSRQAAYVTGQNFLIDGGEFPGS